MLAKTLFSLVAVYVAFLIFDAIRTGSIWVKGGDSEWGKWAHKKSKDEEPVNYWFFLLFYVFALGAMVYAIFFTEVTV